MGAAAGAGLFVVTGLVAFASHAAFDATPEAVLWLFVLLGALLAVGAAYRRGGLLVGSALVFGPVYGPLTFYGHGAPALWTPIAVVLVAVSYALGALGRRVANRPENQ
ncbi:hypothetical protein [Halorubrum amylolyticum]|uniref:hypothetical protein n=1 Tax=Halorubrum amylolyticum TaxID=2508724 RepID=UPI00100939F9|nr:hypothetical protein [Halorubrum amylolyticum]